MQVKGPMMQETKNIRKIKILLADDHAVVREGIRRVMEQEADFEVVAEAEDGEKAVKLAAECSPDVALIDIVMPKLNGIENQRGMSRRSRAGTLCL
jgi:DNA-binding NarL/FixJ family response regulator